MKHHYIPCFYLKRWANAQGKVVEFSRRYKSVVAKPVSPEWTGFKEDLYKVEGVYPHAEHLIEIKFMASVDQLACNILDKFLSPSGQQFSMTDEQRSAWSMFLILLTQRNPERVTEIKMKLRAILRKNLEKEHFDTNNSDIASLVEMAACLGIQEAINVPRTGNLLNNMHWRLLKINPNDYTLLTSDRPVIFADSGTDVKSIMLPIAPRVLFVATKTPTACEPILTKAYKGVLSGEINDQVVRQAEAFVYATDHCQTDFVRRRLRFPPSVNPRKATGGCG